MRGFHVDMNVAQFNRPYLEKWLAEFARLGYDTIVWEVENNIRWDTCPECASPEAFSKEEFRQILELCRGMGLEPIPLFQTIAHCEYVLKHEKYQHLAEVKGMIEQYCPSNPDVVPFLNRWIEEYLEVFGAVRCFHLGADEALWLGKCDECRAYAERNSLADLYVQHMKPLFAPLVQRGITPIIWADMVLHHVEAVDKLPREVMLFDWMYNIHRGDGRVHVWGVGMRDRDGIPPQALKTFGQFLYPFGDEPGRDPETFYTADYLASKGFQVVTCPASSSARDNAFSPRNWLHVVNTFDSFTKGMSKCLCGSVLTSWTVRLVPWELQLATMDIPSFVARNSGATIEAFQSDFVRDRFGTADQSFFRACGLLSKPCLFTVGTSLGVDKSCMPVPIDHAKVRVCEIAQRDQVEQELADCGERLEEYRQALELFEAFSRKARRGKKHLDLWNLAARNLINRAEASSFLLECAEQLKEARPAPAAMKSRGGQILTTMHGLKEETRLVYLQAQKPTRANEIVQWLFDPVEHALGSLVVA
jgi:hypothetical protein